MNRRTPDRKPSVGDIRDVNGRKMVYAPGHALAAKGGPWRHWAQYNRFEAYRRRGGIATCDKGGETIDWAEARVSSEPDVNGQWTILCERHRRVQLAGDWFPELRPVLVELWAGPCRAGIPRSTAGVASRAVATPAGSALPAGVGSIVNPASRGTASTGGES